MKYFFLIISSLLFLKSSSVYSQVDSAEQQVAEVQRLLKQAAQVRFSDSVKKAELTQELRKLKASESGKKASILSEFRKIDEQDSVRKALTINRIKSLKKTAVGFPVVLLTDTLFFIYTKIGASTAADRAANISKRIGNLYEDDFLKIDSIKIVEADNTNDIIYGETIIMSLSELDALWHDQTPKQLAHRYTAIIKTAISKARSENSISKLMQRIGLVVLVLGCIYLLIRLMNKGYEKVSAYISGKHAWLKGFRYKDYTFLSPEQELHAVLLGLNLLRWFLLILLLYLVLPVVFSIFPFTRGWANILFSLVWSPFKGIFIAVWNYFPNLIRILVTVVVMHYFIKFLKYFFTEIESGNLKITGFYADWAMPTFSIVRFLIYAFMLVLIFPYLPGSDSTIFKGVSVFLGVLISLGSSSAIANMIAGLVITYMRPFKIGDRIRIGDMTGDVTEKTLLITRLRTIKNEEITIPNASILSGHTLNYSSNSMNEGLIMHTTVTIGYDVPWKATHQALLEAAARTELLLQQPKPFVLQTSLDDFYVSYQLNAYTKHAHKQALIYSELHKNIQDVFNENGIEIMSPHYRSLRDGNVTSIPADYLPENYQAPSFQVKSFD